MHVLLVRDDREYLLAPGETLETDLGILEVPERPESGETVETHIGEEFTIRRPRLPDFFEHFERTGAPMMPRDAGLVLGETGAGSSDRVLDAGTGTGVLAAYLANAGAEVLTFERDGEFAANARENFERAGLDGRVTVETGDLVEELDDLADGPPFDVLTLDTEDAPDVVERAPELLVEGGALAVYSPFVEATREVVEATRAAGMREIRARETIQRDLDVDERGTRPSTRGVGHTGYLVFARR